MFCIHIAATLNKIKHFFQLPKHASISPKCSDLLFSLLKYNPDERIGFDAFYKHEFLDLIHVPTIENYLHSVNLIEEAIELDKKKQYSESLPKYREAIRYLEAFIPSETDVNRRAVLELRLKEYVTWADTLEQVLAGGTSIPSSSCQTLPLNENQYRTLYELSAVTPKLMTGLEIGCMGEMYLAEGRKTLALEKLTAALQVLIPSLETEPSGPRKEMLHSQVIAGLLLFLTCNLR